MGQRYLCVIEGSGKHTLFSAILDSLRSSVADSDTRTRSGHIPVITGCHVGNGRDLFERVVGMEQIEIGSEELRKGSETDRAGFTESTRVDDGVVCLW